MATCDSWFRFRHSWCLRALRRCLLRWTVAALLPAAFGAWAAPADVRVIVDVSSAMANADPDNARGAALGALLRMLPPDGRAGVWGYADSVRPLAGYAASDALWRENAAIVTAQLPDEGQRADLAQALDVVSWDRAQPDAGPADLILLTDGRFDVSDDPGVNAARKRRLLVELLPELEAAGYRLHTLAFTDAADTDLLEQLAAATGGYAGHADATDELPRELLGLLGWVAAPARLPVSGQGEFAVAPGTHVLTVVRLGAGLDQPATLVDPAGTRFLRTTRRDRIRWHVDQAFELVTLTDPMPGLWRFDATTGDMQVHAYSDLTVAYRDLPGTLFPAGLRSFDFDLVSDGQVVRDDDFLDLLDVSAELQGPEETIPLIVEREGGGFRVNLLGPRKAGDYVLQTRLAGPTFDQALALPLALVNPLGIDIQPATDGFTVWARVAAPGLEHDSLRIAALMTRPPGAMRLRPMERHPGGLWKLAVPGARGMVEFSLDISGNYINSKDFNLRTDPIRVVLPVTEPAEVNLDIDGQPLIVAAAPEAETTGGEHPPAPVGARPQASAAEEAAGLRLPDWFVALAGLINLALGTALWWLVGEAAPRADWQEAVEALRVALGLAPAPDPEGAAAAAA